MRKLSAEQLRVLRGISAGFVMARPTTLASLVRRGLVQDAWRMPPGTYFITITGRAALDAAKEASE